MISDLLPFTSSLSYIFYLTNSLLHRKILQENQQIESQASLLLNTFSQINSRVTLTNKNDIYLHKKTSHSSASDNSTQNDSEEKNKIFLIRKINDKLSEAKKEKSKLYHRGSKNRGVSKNGGKWQVLIMIIKEMSKYYEVVIFTSADEEYANLILDEIDKHKSICHRLYRKHISYLNGMILKDLSRLGRDLKKTIIVDNNKDNFKLQPDNGIKIKDFIGDMKDRELSRELIRIAMKKKEDIREDIKSIKIL